MQDMLFELFKVVFTYRLQNLVARGVILWKVAVGMPTHHVKALEYVVPEKHQTAIVGIHEGPCTHMEVDGIEPFYTITGQSVLRDFPKCCENHVYYLKLNKIINFCGRKF